MIIRRISIIFTTIFFLVTMIFIFNYKDTIFALIFGILQFFILFSAMFFITGQWLRSINFASIVMFVLFMINRLSLYYYRKALFANDFLLYLDYENWDILIDFKELLLVVIIILFLLAFAIFAYSKNEKANLKLRMSGLISLIILVLVHTKIESLDIVKSEWLKTFPELKNTYMNISMTIGNNSGLDYKSPTFNNSYEMFKNKINTVTNYEISNLKPNIVLWLNESTLDASFYRGNLEQVDMFKGDFKFQTLNRVHTFGGKTWKSEFEVLTGLSPDEFGASSSLVFQYAAPHIKYSLPKNLKEEGYYTIALNPYPGSAYNSKNAYKNFGIDEYIHPSELKCDGAGDKIRKLKYITSMQMGECVKKIFKKYENKQPLFIYMLTINEHAPYNRAKEVKFGLNEFYDESQSIKLTDYYERQIELSKAVINFNDFMLSTNKPYIFAYFGDHQGNMGLKNNDVKFNNFTNPLNITGFYVKGSNGVKEIKNNLMNLSELSLMPSVLLELGQIKPNEFFKANYAMRKICNKVDDCEDKELLESYKSYLYDYLNAANK